MATNLQALQGAIKLLADAAKDTAVAIQPGESALARLMAYQNLVSDVTALVPQVGDLPAELKALQPADGVTLVQSLVTDLALTNEHAEAVVNASLKLLGDLATVIVPDAEALIAAIKQ